MKISLLLKKNNKTLNNKTPGRIGIKALKFNPDLRIWLRRGIKNIKRRGAV